MLHYVEKKKETLAPWEAPSYIEAFFLTTAHFVSDKYFSNISELIHWVL